MRESPPVAVAAVADEPPDGTDAILAARRSEVVGAHMLEEQEGAPRAQDAPQLAKSRLGVFDAAL
jgi:hypothetical protein